MTIVFFFLSLVIGFSNNVVIIILISLYKVGSTSKVRSQVNTA